MTLQAHQPPRRIRRFTLIELLVVVAIIAVLAAMLLPVLGKARLTARVTTCTSQLRQNSMGLAMYADDEGGYFPNFGGNAGMSGIYYCSGGAGYSLALAQRLNGFGANGTAAVSFFRDVMKQDIGAGSSAYLRRPLVNCPVINWLDTKPYMWSIAYFYDSAIGTSTAEFNQAGYAYWTGRKMYQVGSSSGFDTRLRRDDGNEVVMSDVTCGSGNGTWNGIDQFYGGGYNVATYSFTPHFGNPSPSLGPRRGSGNLLLADGSVRAYRLDQCKSSINVACSSKAKTVMSQTQGIDGGAYFVIDE